MKRVLIIGAGSGIAEACARQMAARGDRLFLVARRPDVLAAITADLTTRGAEAVDHFAMDANDYDQHRPMLDKAEAFLGRLDLVLIAHGVLGDQEADQKDWEASRQILETNFMSAAGLLTHIANHMEARDQGGVIAVISSVAGDRGRQSNYIYGSAKAATTAFCQGLRNRLYHRGIHVLTIKPGFVATAMTAHLKQGPLFAKPEAVARGILKAVDKKRNVVYLPFFWRYIMLIVTKVPEFIFKKLKL